MRMSKEEILRNSSLMTTQKQTIVEETVPNKCACIIMWFIVNSLTNNIIILKVYCTKLIDWHLIEVWSESNQKRLFIG